MTTMRPDVILGKIIYRVTLNCALQLRPISHQNVGKAETTS
jgi:hypothetical protein